MNKRPYSKILNDVAQDTVPQPLDLAPAILANIQKGKRMRTQYRTRLVSAALLVVTALVILFYTVPGVAAAIGRWFGYVPGVGLVREGQVRVLAEPVSVTRDGVTVTVDQVVLNAERTVMLYSVDGLSNAAIVTDPREGICVYQVSLRLPDGSSIPGSPEGIAGWDAGYQHRLNYPALPANVNDVTLGISCLFSTRPGSAPENWVIPLHFIPAPPEMTAFPVIEIPTPTAAAVPTATAASTAESTVPTPTQGSESAVPQAAAPLSLTLDRAVQMEDGYLLYATLHWEDTSFTTVDVTDTAITLHLLDGAGQKMRYEIQYDEQTGINWDARKTVLAIMTAPVLNPGPLTLAIDSVLVGLPAEATFVFDPGPNPQPGQQWHPDQEVTLGEYRVRVRTITAQESGYEFEMTSDNGVLNAGCSDTDPNHPIVSGYGGGGSRIDEVTYGFGCGFNYQDGLPEGPLTFMVGSIEVMHKQSLQAQWTPPATSSTLLPTQPPACLTTAAWQASLNQPPALPAGLPAQVFTYRLSDPKDQTGEWETVITSLDGTQIRPVPGASDGAFSPDGKQLAYSTLEGGLFILDLASGQSTPLPGTGPGDFNPVWTPDGTQLIFNRGRGIFDLFITHLDGSNLRQLTSGGVQEFPAGWLPDGSLLYTVPGREYEVTTYQLNLQTGESQVYSNENIESVSPDGKRAIIAEAVFGDRWQMWISRLDGSSRQPLGDPNLWTLSSLWSRDGEWLLASISDTDAGSTIGGLINLSTCQVIPLPHLTGNLLSWAP